jgi:hypothetical protein
MTMQVLNPERIGMKTCPFCKGFGRIEGEICLGCGGFGFIMIERSTLNKEKRLMKLQRRTP